ELSANFDLVSSPNDGVNNATHFSDHLLFAATTIIGGNSKWNFALAPNVSFLLRTHRGGTLGPGAADRPPRPPRPPAPSMLEQATERGWRRQASCLAGRRMATWCLNALR